MRYSKKREKKIILYLVMLSLLLGAFLLPQVVFRIQDRILCRDITLGQRESMDVEALSISYEKSLAVRMTNFAEGLEGNDKFYVTSQELEISREITDFLHSESVLSQNMIIALVEGGMLPYEIWNDDFEITQWKRYVIYSDDYAKGVNYILWYIEMQASDGSVFKLLVDAEDATIYGLRTENIYRLLTDGEQDYLLENLTDSYVMTQLWGFFTLYYEAMSEDSINLLYNRMGEGGWLDINHFLDEEVRAAGGNGAEIFGVSLENAGYEIDAQNRSCFRVPYNNTFLEVLMKVEGPEVQSSYRYRYRDLTMGVRQICEMIPEFA